MFPFPLKFFQRRKRKHYFSAEETPSLDDTDTREGFIGYGLSVQKALYADPRFRKVLRLYKIGEISRKFTNTQFISSNNFKDAESLGAFRKATLSIKAVNENTVYPLYGKIHNTTMIISSTAILSEISSFFARNSIKIGPENVPYKIVENSVKLIANRSSNATLY